MNEEEDVGSRGWFVELLDVCRGCLMLMMLVELSYYTLILPILFVLLCYGQTASKQVCPCFCDTSNRMNCAFQDWKIIPPKIPSFVTAINFQINNVEVIKANSFRGLTEVVLLRFDRNKLRTIEPKAFYGMTKLNELVLNSNKITHFDDTMVDPKSPLRRGIFLTGNRLERFPLNLLKRHRVTINTSVNRIKCDCFTVIPDELKQLVFGECTTGEGIRRSISSVRYEEVGCQSCYKKGCVHGSCSLDGNGDAKCICFTGYTGPLCDIDISSRPMGNGDVSTSSSSIQPTSNPTRSISITITTITATAPTTSLEITPSKTIANPQSRLPAIDAKEKSGNSYT